MSALTDLFTALANKIRSKTGEATTYTPLQMVSDGIDDVYQAGVDAGETPTQTKTVTAGTSAVTVTPDAGYALSSVTVNPTPSQSKSATPTTSAQTVTPNSGYLLSQVDVAPIPSEYKIPSLIMPSNTPGLMREGEAYSPVSDAYIIKEYREIYPNDAYPVAIYVGMLEAKDSGYAIRTYSSTSKTPSPTGEYFASGWNRMTSAGYAYSSKPQMSETTLWTNSSPTSNFAAQTITLSQDIDNYDYLKITYRLSTSASTELSLIISVQDFKNTADANGKGVITLNSKSSNVIYARLIFYGTDTSVFVSVPYKIGSSGNSQAYSIPTKISGLKY